MNIVRRIRGIDIKKNFNFIIIMIRLKQDEIQIIEQSKYNIIC